MFQERKKKCIWQLLDTFQYLHIVFASAMVGNSLVQCGCSKPIRRKKLEKNSNLLEKLERKKKMVKLKHIFNHDICENLLVLLRCDSGKWWLTKEDEFGHWGMVGLHICLITHSNCLHYWISHVAFQCHIHGNRKLKTKSFWYIWSYHSIKMYKYVHMKLSFKPWLTLL